MNYLKLTSYHDGGHGWLRVPIEEIRLAVLQGLEISRFSYISEKFVYLEEDCDVSAWINFRQIPQETISKWKQSYRNGSSPIRNLPSFNNERLKA